MTAQNGVNTALTRPGRVFPRPFTHGGFVPPIWGDKTRAEGQNINGGTHEGGHRPYGGPNFDRLYHKLKVLLMLSCNYMMQFIGYDSIKLVDLYFIAFNGAQ